MEEYFDVFDIDGNLIRKKELRGNPLKKGEYRKIVQALLINPEGKILLTLRSADKSIAPGLWECSAGCVLSGEATEDAVIREVFEEVGINLDLASGRIIKHFIEDDSIFELWTFPVDQPLEKLILDYEEVESARYVNFKELEKIIQSGKATKSLPMIQRIIKSQFAGICT